MARNTKSGSGTRRMTHQIGLRVDAAIYAAIEEKAGELGIDRGAYLRDLVHRDIRRLRARPTPRYSAADLAALASLAMALGRAAGATIQLERRVREAGGTEDLAGSVGRLSDELRPLQVAILALMRDLTS